MIYGIKLYNKIKIFNTQTSKTFEYIAKQHTIIYQKNFKINDIYLFNFIPNELILGNYLIFNADDMIDDKIKKIKQIGNTYQEFGLLESLSESNKINLVEDSINLKPYEKSQDNCEINDSTKLILDNNMVKITIYYSKETMKIYFKNMDNINQDNFDIELFPELENIGTYEFKLSLDNLKEKLLDKYYYSSSQVKLAIKGLTLNGNKVLTNEKLINIFHQNFNFEKVKEYSIEEILSRLSLTYSEENVKDFYRLSLEYYLNKNNIMCINEKYNLEMKNPFVDIPKENPIRETEFNNMINNKIKERVNCMSIN
tara:strand:- start:8792 stop:9727 length:936 start_codon:yes stop_codon:yes gene_type:complete